MKKINKVGSWVVFLLMAFFVSMSLTTLKINAAPILQAPTIKADISFSNTELRQNQQITVKINSNGGKDLRYKYAIYDGQAWKVVQDYSPNNYYNWTPQKAGTYRIWVDIKEANSNNDYDTYVNTYVTLSYLDIKNMTTSVPSPQISGTQIKITTNDGIEMPNVLYKYSIFDGTSWKTIRDYSQDKNCNWVPEKGGNHRIWVDAKNTTTGEVISASILYDVIQKPIVSKISFDNNMAAAGEKTRIKVDAKGDGKLLYKFAIDDGSGWKVVKDYTNDNYYDWTPSKAGSYRIWVDIKDERSANSYDSYINTYYNVLSPLVINNITNTPASPQVSGSQIKFTTNEGFNTLGIQYQYSIYDGVSWKILRSYSDDPTVVWAPEKGGNYRVWVDAKDKISGRVISASILYDIIQRPILNSITFSTPSPGEMNKEIRITANANRSTNVLYKYAIDDGSGWKVVQDYTTSNSIKWVPTSSGTYRIWIDIKDKLSPNDYDSYCNTYYNISSTPFLTNIKTDNEAPQIIGNKIKITANKDVALKDVLYKFTIFNGLQWKVIREYGESNTCDWIPDRVGSNRIWVDIKDKFSSNFISGSILYNIVNEPKLNSVTTSKPSPAIFGDTINIKADAAGGLSRLYRYSIKDGNGWKVIQDQTPLNSISWTPELPGKYDIKVELIEGTLSKVYDTKIISQYAVGANINIKSITTNLTSPRFIGQDILISVNENISILGAEYKLSVHDGTQWTTIKDYSDAQTAKWTPSKAANHKILAEVRDKITGKVISSSIMFEVVTKPVFTGITFSQPQPGMRGKNITISANAIGGKNLLYKFAIFDGEAWTVVQDYSPNKTYSWTPDRVKNYRVWIDVKDSNSPNDYDDYGNQYFNIISEIKLTSISSNIVEPQRIGNNITLYANSTGGNKVLYRFKIFDGVSWNVVKDFSESNTFLWIPTKELNYTIEVDARDINSKDEVDVSIRRFFQVWKFGVVNYYNVSATLDNYSTIQMGKSPIIDSSAGWTTPTFDQLKYYVNPDSFYYNERYMYMFMNLNYADGISIDDLNLVLKGQGVLDNKGEVFLRAGREANVNPVYLVAHALLETGNGTSRLASGINVTTADGIKTVYNMYGIGAYDSDPIGGGSTFALNKQWFSVDAAIIGGAKWISDNYITSSTYKQNTLYKMKWNPVIDNIWHQYATDVAWAYNQTYKIKQLVDKMKSSVFYFDIPVYLK